MLRQVCRAVVVIGCAAIAVSGWAATPKKTGKSDDPGRETVEKVLRAEVAGQVDRRGQLAETLERDPNSAAARWQAGFVRDGDAWRSFDATVSVAAESESLKRYRLRREDAPVTFAGQIDLANWCKKQGLANQEQAHLHAALLLEKDRNNADILARLGYRVVGGVWLSRDDLRDWHRINQQTTAALKRWETKLKTIASGLSGSARQRELAVKQLREIAEPASIPAIELALTGQSEEAALAVIAAFQRIDGPEAAVALAKQAIFSSSPDVRTGAIVSLKARNLDHFVPDLISLLATPVAAEMRWIGWSGSTGYNWGSGVLLISYVLARETDRQFEVASFQVTNYLVNAYVDVGLVQGPRYRATRGNNIADLEMFRGQNDQLRLTGDRARTEERAVAELNERIGTLNARIGKLLSAVSGREESSDPHVWWKWWNEHSDLQQDGYKAVVAVSETEVVGNPASGFYIASCFAAGSPVWTERGAQPIETITVGDRVLAKDVETGELAYKPVLHTTVRPPKELTTLRFGDETIVCTGGHRFWSSGTGWIKARDLTTQTLLHAVTGNTPVWSAKKGSAAETYNLVVADFHTYFVGKPGLLCQDLLIPKGTNNVVPGLVRSNSAAKSAK